jgi:hypothetical protein
MAHDLDLLIPPHFELSDQLHSKKWHGQMIITYELLSFFEIHSNYGTNMFSAVHYNTKTNNSWNITECY